MTRFQIVGPASLPELSSCRADGENTIPDLRSPAPQKPAPGCFFAFLIHARLQPTAFFIIFAPYNTFEYFFAKQQETNSNKKLFIYYKLSRRRKAPLSSREVRAPRPNDLLKNN